MQDMWHQGSDTWFDRTADLRVLLNGGGGAPLAYGANAAPEGAPAGANVTPAVWVRASGNTLDRDDRESVNAFGETFRYNLDRNLESTDFQMGLDLGRRGLLSPTTSWCSGCSAASSTALSITTISRGPSTSRAGRSAATPPILGAGCSSTPLPTCICSTSTPTRPWASPLPRLGVRTDSGYRFGSFKSGPAPPWSRS